MMDLLNPFKTDSTLIISLVLIIGGIALLALHVISLSDHLVDFVATTIILFYYQQSAFKYVPAGVTTPVSPTLTDEQMQTLATILQSRVSSTSTPMEPGKN